MEFVNDVNMMTVPELIGVYVDDFVRSEEYRLMMDGASYYTADNTLISRRKMTRFDEFGREAEDIARPNHRYKHAFMTVLVDDKINYLLTKPYTMECEDEAYLDSVQELLGGDFQNRLVRIGTDASNKGVSWVHPIIGSDGTFKLVLIPGDQVIPLWGDNEHRELDALIWFYRVEAFEGKERKWITKAEYWTSEGVAYYVRENEHTGIFMLDAEKYLDEDFSEDEFVPHFRRAGKPDNWGKVPFVAFKNNDYELPDIKFVKSLIDGYDFSRSDVANVLEDVKSTVFGLRGYGGENLAEFMRDMSLYRAVKLDEDGGMETYSPMVDIAAASEHYNALRKDIYSFGGGVDKNSDKIGNSPSGIALKFIYSGLDLKCNKMESCFKTAFCDLLYFINRYLEISGKSVSDKPVKIIFNRDIAINESQAIADCLSSVGIISDETILANHPWVNDVDDELKKLARQNESEPDMAAGHDDEDDDEGDKA